MNQKSPNPIDAYVGAKVRLQRQFLQLSQSALADALGITFQQVQKYEKGVNRIGASRLQAIARVLGVPISFFFKDSVDEPVTIKGIERPPMIDQITQFLSSPEGIKLNSAYAKIKDRKVRRSIINLVQAIAEAELNGPSIEFQNQTHTAVTH